MASFEHRGSHLDQTTHGMRHTPEYTAWCNMLARCNNPKNTMYRYYGGRGIAVDPVFRSFEAFFAEIGCRPGADYSLDRKDNDRNYEPGNVRWLRKRDQMINRSDNRYLTHAGKTQTLREWSNQTNIPLRTLWARLEAYNWNIERALTEPVWSRSKAGKHGAIARWQR